MYNMLRTTAIAAMVLATTAGSIFPELAFAKSVTRNNRPAIETTLGRDNVQRGYQDHALTNNLSVPATNLTRRHNGTNETVLALAGRHVAPFANLSIEAPKLMRRHNITNEPAQLPSGRYIYKEFMEHNVTTGQYLAATQTEGRQAIVLTDAQVDAILAADEAPEPVPYVWHSWDGDGRERAHLSQIYRALDAGLSLQDIHGIFHDADGMPFYPTDVDADEKIAAAAGKAKLAKRNSVTYDDSAAPDAWIHISFASYNITPALQLVALYDEDNNYHTISKRRVDAICATSYRSVRPDKEEEKPDLPRERRRLEMVYRAMDGGIDWSYLDSLFHHERWSKGYDLDEESVDYSIDIYYGFSCDKQDCSKYWDGL